jgi:cyclic pyranopterin phosphate synthase
VIKVAGLLALWDMVKQYEKDSIGMYPDTFITNVKVENKIKKEI